MSPFSRSQYGAHSPPHSPNPYAVPQSHDPSASSWIPNLHPSQQPSPHPHDGISPLTPHIIPDIVYHQTVGLPVDPHHGGIAPHLQPQGTTSIYPPPNPKTPPPTLALSVTSPQTTQTTPHSGPPQPPGSSTCYIHMVRFKRQTRPFQSRPSYPSGSYVKVEADRGEVRSSLLPYTNKAQ